MPPQPIFKSSRSQTAAVAAISALVLLGSTGLAYLQAGGKARQALNPVAQPTAPRTQELRLNYPKDWQPTQDSSHSTVLTDPGRPLRQLKIINLQNKQKTAPDIVMDRYIQTQIDTATRETLHQQPPRIIFTSDEFGFAGVEFLGIRYEGDGEEPPTSYEQHLLACLSNDGVSYWILYLTDTTSPQDIEQSFKDNTTLLRAIYRSARFADE